MRKNDGFQTQSILGTLLLPFRAVQDWFSDAMSGDKAYSDGESSSLVRKIMFPLKFLWGFLVFMVQAWTTSRNGYAFLRGLPALAVLAVTPFLVWGLINYAGPITLGPTMGYRKMHLTNKAYDNATMFSEKLVALRPESKQFKYFLADDLFLAGDAGEANRIMAYIAGSTDVPEAAPEVPATAVLPGDLVAGIDEATEEETEDVDPEAEEVAEEPEKFSDAHVWIAQKLLRKQRSEGYEEARNEKAMEHLRAAINVDPENVKAQVNLIDLYTTKADSFEDGSEENIENLKLARSSLERLTGYSNFSRLEQVLAMPQLIDVCVQLDDLEGARRELGNATTKISRVAQLNPDIYPVWYALVRSAVALEDYERANEFIKTGVQNVTSQENRQRIMRLASEVYLKNADDFPDLDDENQFRTRLFALCKAITNSPKDVKIYDRLVDYIDVEADKPERDVWLRNSILDCPIPGVVHILIGTRELLRGDVVAGKTSWDIARHQFGSTEFVTHRLLSVAIKKRPEFGEGSLLDTALLLFPSQYMLYETRGAIRKQRGEYEDAISDFETVLEKVPDLITAHKYLKDIYVATNQPEKAKFHAGRVDELLELVDENDREKYRKVLNKL